MPTVFIPSQLRELTSGLSTVEVDGVTVREIVQALDQRFPGCAERLCCGDDLNPALQVSINNAISTRGLNAKVSPDTEIHFIAALGGG